MLPRVLQTTSWRNPHYVFQASWKLQVPSHALLKTHRTVGETFSPSTRDNRQSEALRDCQPRQ